MKTILLFYFLFLFTNLNSQELYLSTNLSGNYRIICNDTLEEIIKLSKDEFTKVKSCSLLVIEKDEVNLATTIFKLNTRVFSDKDTLNLYFIEFTSNDTINYSSSCIDGTFSENKIEIKPLGTNGIYFVELPENIILKTSKKEIIFKKTIGSSLIISSGNGIKHEKKWGYSSSTKRTKVYYSN
jgi:hypothetical protein